MGTQLLVIQHLRRHLPLAAGRDFLIWHPMENIDSIDRLMQSIISNAGFADVLDIRDFASMRPRTAGPIAWLFESPRRLRQDASTLRGWMAQNRIEEQDVELWADDPIHFNVVFSRGLLRNAKQVKIPHCFNHEDDTIAAVKKRLEWGWREEPWLKRYFFYPWQRWLSGVDLRRAQVLFDRAYTFDLPSLWCVTSVDVSGLISIEAFQNSYGTLPVSLRQEVDAILAPINAGPRPLVLLLLFGLTGVAARAYQKAVGRIFAERGSELKNCSLAVKVHPAARGPEEAAFIAWLRENVPAQVFAIAHNLNLEFMLPQLRPDYVWAGPCGALPIVKRLGAGRAIVLPEIVEHLTGEFPLEREKIAAFAQDFEAW